MKDRLLRNFSLTLLCFTLYACADVNSPANSLSDAKQFTIVVIPDTQNAIDFRHQKAEGFAIDGTEVFIQQMQSIANKGIENGGDVAFVASVGDVWQHVNSAMDPSHLARGIRALETVEGGYNTYINPEVARNFEIPKSIEGYQLISEAGIPFGVAPGNHDYDAWWAAAAVKDAADSSNVSADTAHVHVGGLDNFRLAFGSDTDFFRDKDWYVSGYQGGGSSAQLFSAGGYNFLHLALEMHPGAAVIAWAQDVINEYAGLPTLLSTHDYLNPRGERLPSPGFDLAAVDPEHNYSAEELWQGFIRKNDQIFMILSGHQLGQALRIDENENNNAVYQILADYQGRGQVGIDAGQSLTSTGSIVGIGDGWYREMVFHLGGAVPRVDVKTFSSHYARYSSRLNSYATWYKKWEQPGMSDREFLEADEFTIRLNDFYSRFGMPVN